MFFVYIYILTLYHYYYIINVRKDRALLMKLVLKNALVYTGNGFVKNEILIENSKISAIGVSVSSDGA